MKLITRLRDDLAVDLDVSAIFLSPTPRQLAARIEAATGDAGHGDRRTLVVDLNGAADLAPMFVVHAVGGTVHGYVPLAGELAATYHVHGIEAAGAREGTSPARTLDAMVAAYVEAVRGVQPAGPYRLAGWSMGGIVAFEMARLLEELGEEVELLVLLDAPCMIPEEPQLSEGHLAAEFVADAARTAGWPVDDIPAGADAEDHLGWMAGRVDEVGDGAQLRVELRRRFEIFAAHRRLLSGYRPEAGVQADALTIGARRSPNAAHQPLWAGVLRGDVSQVEVAGDHYSFLQAPVVHEVAGLVLGRRAAEPAR
jgi:thioesterase domain-containing protein